MSLSTPHQRPTTLSSLQLPHATGGAPDAISHWEDLPIVETAATGTAAETLVVPFAAEGLNVLANDGQFAPLALWSPPLCPLGLALDAPGVAVLFNVRHTLLKGVAALGAKEVSVVEVVSESDDMITQDGCRARLAARGKQFVPIQVAEEAQACVAILGHGLTGLFSQGLAGSTSGNAVEARRSEGVGLWRNLKCL